jgi:Uma2 family endonuclease
MHATPLPRMTPDEYLAWERAQTEKHDYFRGEIFAMSGASLRHNRLSLRIAGRLESALSGGPCDTFVSDQRVAIDDAHYVYPDVVVACRPHQLKPGRMDTLTQPRVVIEVLSPSTEAYDRGPKLTGYLAIPSLQNLVLVSQRERRLEVYTRESDGGFHYESYGAGSIARLPSIDVFVPLDELYTGIFDLPGEDEPPTPPAG